LELGVGKEFVNPGRLVTRGEGYHFFSGPNFGLTLDFLLWADWIFPYQPGWRNSLGNWELAKTRALWNLRAFNLELSGWKIFLNFRVGYLPRIFNNKINLVLKKREEGWAHGRKGKGY